MEARAQKSCGVLAVLALVLAACGTGDDGSNEAEDTIVATTGSSTVAESPAGPDTTIGAAAPVSCDQPYDAEILDPRPLPESVNPDAAKPPIEEMTITAGDLGGEPDLEPTWYDELTVTPEQVNEICSMNLKAVFLDWDSVLYNQIIRSGMRLSLNAMGIELSRVTSFSFDPNGLAGDLAAVMPLEPDIIFTGGTIDPNQMAAILQPAADAGIPIISWGVGARGWDLGGEEMVTMVGYDFYQLGQQMADAVCEQYPDGANLGYLHWINNVSAIHLREQGLLDGLSERCPQITVTADGGEPDPTSPESGFNDPNNSQAEVAAFLVRHPEVNVLFAPWEDPPGVGYIAALQAQNREDVDIVTMDLGLTGAPQLASGEGPITVDMAQSIFDGGRTMAIAAGLHAIGEEVPPFLIFPTFPSTTDNLADAWEFMHGPEFALPVEVGQ